MNLIAITGRLHAGKDEAAKAFIAAGYRRESFADPLKVVVAHLADEDVELYHNVETKELHSSTLGMTRRKALQLMGTEGVRNIFGEDFWARRLLGRWQRLGQPMTVIADCRFDNEAQLVRNAGGVVVRIHRPDNDADSVGVPGHASEAGVRDELVNFTILNDGSIEQLHDRCRILLDHLFSGV